MKRLTAKVPELTHAQRQALLRQLAALEGQAASVGVIEDRIGGRCPHCGSTKMIRNGHAHGLQRYKCRACNRSFNALTGTSLARLRQKGKWLVQAEAVREGLTIKQAAARLQVAPSTAFRWRHRFLALPKTVQAQYLVGIAEADETFFLHSCKGQAVMESDHRSGAPETAKTTFPSPKVHCPCGEIRNPLSGGGGSRKRETSGAFCNLAGRLGPKSSERRVGEPRPCPAATEGRGDRAV